MRNTERFFMAQCLETDCSPSQFSWELRPMLGPGDDAFGSFRTGLQQLRMKSLDQLFYDLHIANLLPGQISQALLAAPRLGQISHGLTRLLLEISGRADAAKFLYLPVMVLADLRLEDC